MEYIRIEGGYPLSGEVEVQSSKNAALPIIAAVLLAKGTTILEKCPKITDVFHMAEILEEIGCKVWWEQDNLCVDTTDFGCFDIRCTAARSMRSSCLFLGSLLGRLGEAALPYPGGCVIGKRPIDIHMEGLRHMGVQFEETASKITAKAVHLKGAQIHLPYPSVGATENLMLAGVLAEGVTVITGCAIEPEVVELSGFLKKMGARIEWQKNRTLLIEGVDSLQPCTYRIPPDRIVAGTYLLAAAAARGTIVLRNAPWKQLGALNIQLLKMGGSIRIYDDVVEFDGSHAVHGVASVKTMPYPEFPTDLQPQLAAALSIAKEESEIEETVFESRFATMAELNKMQADITVSGDYIHIHPVKKLIGADVHAGDLRGGAALVAAGLVAEGITRVTGCEFLERGYADIVGDLIKLGARLEKISLCSQNR